MIAERWGQSRTQLDEYSVASHEKAAAAIDGGRFAAQITPVKLEDGTVVDTDEGIRRGSTVEGLAKLKPAFRPDGVIHAGNSSQISDGAAALLMTTSEKAAELGLTPVARVHTAVLAADDPVIMLTAPIPATQQGPREERPEPGRHRRLRGQRGVRPGPARLARRDRRRPGQAQPQRRRDRPRPPPRRQRRPPDDHPGPPHARQRHPLRPADHVRGRRPGQRHHPRTPVRINGKEQNEDYPERVRLPRPAPRSLGGATAR